MTVTVPEAAERVFGAVEDLFGADRGQRMPQACTASEDFSYVLEQVPGAFVLLSATPRGADYRTQPGNHSTSIVFDDSVLADGSALLAELALRAGPQPEA
ncbi:MAG: hypothetical protein ABF811_05395 [Pseudoclavibacter sp.]